MGLQAPVE